MRSLYFECFSGISGDMTLAALNALGVPEEYIRGELDKLGVGGFRLEFEKVVRNGLTVNSANVLIEEHAHGHNHEHSHKHNHEHSHEHNHEHNHEHSHEHRSHADIVKIIDKSGITPGAKDMAKRIFLTIARAEAKVHGQSTDTVHFHEVGAVDSIVDIVGVAVCIDYLKPDKIRVGVVSDGYGFTECRHGIIPIPVPATAEIFAACGVKTKRLDIEAELVTPTGAGIIAALAEFAPPEEGFSVKRIGYGAGKRELKIPNVLRVCLCEEGGALNSSVAVIEANIDNQTPESIAFAMERLFEAGAYDVFFTPIQMKKNRPASKLTALCGIEDTEKMCGVIFENTSTIGVRMREEKRVCLSRSMDAVSTRYGEIDVKISTFGEYRRIAPEFESARAAALRCGVPLDEVYGSVHEALVAKKEI